MAGLAPHWKVVGGVGKGGILVREGAALSTNALPERLQTGALVEQIELVADRLQYQLLSGVGPSRGWVSLRVSNKDLLIAAVHAQDSSQGASPPPRERQRPAGGAQQRVADGKKVRIHDLAGSEQEQFNGKPGVMESFDPATGLYKVKVIVLGSSNIGVKQANQTYLHLPFENISLHADQVEKDNVLNGDEIVLLGAGDAKRKLYEVKLDPQYWYDKAIDRVLNAKNDFEVLDLPVRLVEDQSDLKRAYRKISLAVHPDKNKHPQATDAFRKVYGAFETLMDERQQRRLLWIMGMLDPSSEDHFQLDEDEEDELFQWWWEASVPQIEKQVAEMEGQKLDEFGAMWISSDGLGANVEDVGWIGLTAARRLHAEKKALFVDVRDYPDFVAGHIEGAYSTPLPDMIDYGVINVFLQAGDDLIHKMLKKMPIIVYSEVATPFSRCRAWSRWLFRAGHATIKAAQVRRLRGGIFGWKHKGGPVSGAIQDEQSSLGHGTDGAVCALEAA